ncbi:SixA phosphatase family protein [Sediminitomix flava]|uniref:Phosphohistidine phosphatase n=1 Tax=Sediminitomix flava TaxID=379075 RepID=A0A315Z4K9_SEDFL|nr:histidine phosphatase family protein [Sediminitomix flava]PWJ38413.1 phosphohistidine phosphatase [Sediminitomix flava]
MKNLYLIRHAKSSWKDPSLDDYDRPLNKRGKLAASKMGSWMNQNQYFPDLILTSKAIRAKRTARLIADELKLDFLNIIEDHSLYDCPQDHIMKYLQKLDDRYDSVYLVFHNPSITKLANDFIQDFYFDNIVTSGIVGLKFSMDSWSDISKTQADLLFYQFPKNF